MGKKHEEALARAKAAFHYQVGFDLRGGTKHYSSPEHALIGVEIATQGIRAAGVVFNVVVVPQAKGDEMRYIPILNCWRAPASGPTELSYMGAVARAGFICFA